MITRVNPLGHISLTNDYFSGLVAEAAKNCYGIAAMGQSSAASTVREALRNGSLPEKGVTVSQQEGRLVIQRENGRQEALRCGEVTTRPARTE